MKPSFIKALAVVALGCTFNAVASPISTSSYQLTSLTGNFVLGQTDWNGFNQFGALNNVTQRALVQSILSDGYVAMYSPGNGQFNGIYSGYPSSTQTIEFAFNGGADVTLDSLTFLSSRSYSNTTSVMLQYAHDGSAWQTALNTTAGQIGITTGVAHDYTLNFGGVTADAFRLVLGGNQISLHEITINGAEVAQVPEPVSIALLGLGLFGLGATRKRAFKHDQV